MSEIQGETLLLRRMLGPAEQEVSCDECFAQLDRYVELELAGVNPEATLSGMRAHLEGCSACAEDHKSLHAFIQAVDSERRSR